VAAGRRRVLAVALLGSCLAAGIAAGATGATFVVAAQVRLQPLPLVVRGSSLRLSAGRISGTATVANRSRKRVRSTVSALSWRRGSSGALTSLERVAVRALAAGKSTKLKFGAKVPAAASAGTYSLFVCLDVDSQLRRFSQKLNCSAAGKVVVKGSPPPPVTPPDTTITSGPSGIVNTPTAAFAFTSSVAGSGFQCGLDGGPWVACSSPQQYTGLVDGGHVFQVRAVASGTPDPTPAQASWTIDTTAPVVSLTSPANGAVTNNDKPTFSGAAGTAAGDSSTVTVRIYSGSTATGSPVQTLTTTAAAGAWSVAPSIALADGTYTAQASQSDSAGNTGTSSASTFTVNTTSPLVSLTAPVNGSSTNHPKPTFTGTAGTAAGDSAVSVSVYSGTTPTGTAVQTLTAMPSPDGSWSVAPTAALADGTYTAQASQSDSAGNTGTSSASTFTVDTVAPVVSLTAPADGSSTNQSKPSFAGAAGTSSGDLSTVTVRIYSGSTASGAPVQTLTTTAAAGAWSVAPSTSLTDGTYTAQASQSDSAGNTGMSSAITFTVDTVAPTVTLTAPVDGSSSNHAKPSFSGAAGTATGDSSTITVKIYSGNTATGSPVQTLTTTAAAGAWSVAPSTSLTDGTYTAQASQSDSAGNTGISTANTFTVDTTPPAVTLTAPANGSTTGRSKPSFSGAAGTEAGDSSTVTIEIYSGSTATGSPVQTLTTTAAAGAWSVAPSTALAVGTYTAQASQSDNAGNTGTTTANTFTVQPAAPAPTTTITSAPSGRVPIGPVSITFTANETGSTFQCSLDGAAFADCSSPYNVSSPTPGPHTFAVQATNTDGVTETAPATASWSSVQPEQDLCGQLLGSMTIGPDYANVYIITCNLDVPSLATLTAQPGTIIKADTGTQLTVEGTLNATGTSANPISFTSVNDGSIGGSTGDGSPAAGDWGGIAVSGQGSLDLEHATVEFGGTVGGSGISSFTAVNDVFKSDSGLGEIIAQGASVIVKNDTFTTPSQSAAIVSSPALQLSGNTATGVATGTAYWADSSALDFAGLSSNTTDQGGLAVSGNASTSTWSGSIPLLLHAGGEGIYGYFNLGTRLDVPSGVTLTLSPGSIVKGQGADYCGNVICSLSVEGTLDAVGTSGSPVTFTSIFDKSIGGDTGVEYTTRDGSPAAGDWGGIYVGASGSFDLEGTTLEYASTALAVADGAGGTIHGKVLHSAMGVSSDTYVDATDVDWGDSSGPSPIGSGTPVSGGGVAVEPWVGFVAPPVPANTDPYVPPSTYQCAGVAFIGARGSGQPPQGNPETFNGPGDGLGSQIGEIYQSFYNNVTKYGTYGPGDIKELGVQYEALGTEQIPLHFGDYWDSIYDGVYRIKSMIQDEEANCPGEKLVLSGYSQGALAIHIALLELAQSDPNSLNSGQIAALVLLADPAKVSNGAETTWEGDLQSAGSGVQNADGIWTKFGDLIGVPTGDQGPLPASVVGQTLAMCHNHDIVCSPGLGASPTNHTDYSTAELDDMGLWAADTYLGLPTPATT
jgi:hypothetical protein